MWQSLGGLGLALAMLAGLWLSLQKGLLYTRRSYLDLLALSEKLLALQAERIADLKESAAMLRETNREREKQLAILLDGRRT